MDRKLKKITKEKEIDIFNLFDREVDINVYPDESY